MEQRLRELMECIEEWPAVAQAEAVAALEAIAGYVTLCDPSAEER